MDLGLKECLEIAKHLQKGDVLLWNKFKFDNGDTKNKYLIILSNCVKDYYYFYVMPTSQTSFYKKNPFEKRDTIILKSKEVPFFPLETVIDFKKIRRDKASKIGARLQDKTVSRIGKLSPEKVEEFDNRIKCAETIDPRTKKLILEG
jgi:hypothetical protein